MDATNMKPSKSFEGNSSSLKKTFDKAVEGEVWNIFLPSPRWGKDIQIRKQFSSEEEARKWATWNYPRGARGIKFKKS